MVHCRGKSLIYGNIVEVVNNDVIGDVVKISRVKNNEWRENIMHCVDWESMGFYMGDLSGPRVTNVIEFSHDSQHDGQQKGIFCEDSTETRCTVDCREIESHVCFISYRGLICISI